MKLLIICFIVLCSSQLVFAEQAAPRFFNAPIQYIKHLFTGTKNQQKTTKSYDKKSCSIEGMSCSSCEYKIKDKLSNNPNVKNIEIDVQTGKAIIEFDTDKTSIEEIKSTIESLDYKVTVDS